MDGVAQEWIQTLPPVTRSYVVASAALATVDYLGYLKLSDILMSKNNAFNSDTLWRIPLNILYNGPLSIDFATRLYFFSRYSLWLETSVNSSRNFLWMIFILVIMINLYSILVTNLALFGPTLKDVLLYIWTKKNTDVEVSFIFFTVKGDWIPWISVFSDMAFMGYYDSKVLPIKLAGIIIGHIFWFIDTQIPILHKCQSPFTPIWELKLLKNLIENGGQQEQEQQEQEQQEQLNILHTQQEEQHEDIEEHIQLENNSMTEEFDDHEISQFMNESDFQRETFDTLRNRNH
ncbi:hypothetical protein CANINC_003467 [Pichia inconspicua]|uniref:Derlin n=1 Tax=Pichia inconspicua TaxID=52247 RepID=A0A4T0X051_9ASCO|nr:hypothetical protein CANINC_003467 [[Candida] inconspicua]